jgi:hypothetical protein
VGALALQDAGLKGSFHGNKSGTDIQKSRGRELNPRRLKKARNSIDFRRAVQMTIFGSTEGVVGAGFGKSVLKLSRVEVNA